MFSGLLMGLGIAGFGMSQSVWMSLPMAALAGLGCANIYPLTMSMVAQVPGQPAEKNVATLSLVAFTAFLIGPPAIGLMAGAFGLPAALALLAPLGLLPMLLVPRAPPPQPQ
jgi:MFS family permease